MTVDELMQKTGFTSISLSDPHREIEGVYIGDLLSWVMGRARENDVWITIMSNVNVIAVASLADVSCVVLAEGVTLENDIVLTAKAKGINVLSSEAPIYETAIKLRDLLHI